MKPHDEPLSVKDQDASVRACLRYIQNRPRQFDYLTAIQEADSTIKNLNKRQLERIYRRKTQINKQGERWVPINLGISNPLRIAFSQKLFKQRPENMETFWNIQYFKGISPPYVVFSEEAIIRFVVSTPRSIGYINACHFDSRVRVVMKLTYQDTNNTCNTLSQQ